MLTEVEQAGAAGIRNIQWDAVELPSQFMENFCCDKHTMFVNVVFCVSRVDCCRVYHFVCQLI